MGTKSSEVSFWHTARASFRHAATASRPAVVVSMTRPKASVAHATRRASRMIFGVSIYRVQKRTGPCKRPEVHVDVWFIWCSHIVIFNYRRVVMRELKIFALEVFWRARGSK